VPYGWAAPIFVRHAGSLRHRSKFRPAGHISRLIVGGFSMTAKAIMRVGKLKSLGSVGGSEKHTARLQDTPNADPTKENIRLMGNNNDPSLEEIVLAKISNHTKHKPRKDAVLCSEIFLSASPEYFRPHDPSMAGEWDDSLMWNFASASKKWLQDNFGDKCVRAELHLDESTPHIHAYIVPINDKTKQLSHKAMFGGDGRQASIKLSKLQDSYAAALAPLGIERGVKGSQATHTKVKEYYSAVNKEPLTLELGVNIAKLSPGASSIKMQFVVCSNMAETLIFSFQHSGNFG
jgi:Plasmid recombination enzyme